MKKILALVLVLCMALSLCACGAKEEAPAEELSNITIQIGPNPETLDPALNSAIDGANMLVTLFETLLIIDENLEVKGGQAESWDVTSDGLGWTFTMRDGL